MNIDDAVVLVRTQVQVQADIAEAQQTLLTEALRWRKALLFYAKRETWLDGVAQDKDGDDDNGIIARYALRLDDYPGQPRILLEEKA
jgi:hypothetical protein